MSKYNPSIQTSILILVLIVTAVITPNLFQMSVILGNLRILKENLYSIHRVDCSHSTFHAQGICISYSSLVYCSPLFIWFHMVLFTILGLLRRLLEPNMFTNSSLLIQYCFLFYYLDFIQERLMSTLFLAHVINYAWFQHLAPDDSHLMLLQVVTSHSIGWLVTTFCCLPHA